MADITISVRDNGPYLVRGGATVTDADGMVGAGSLGLVAPGIGRSRDRFKEFFENLRCFRREP